ILTDEAAEFQGGVGTAGSANIGNHYAMFEAIHGSAPRMVEEGREMYADPSSVMRAAVMLLSHIGYQSQSDKLAKALDLCTVTERKIKITGKPDGATSAQLSDYILETIQAM
ncbi:MAG: isocitrate/isopropylmalate dehydrogenase family protein, partial [Firmicutes bacterium]|nr:isocitrate/isopropylmalate dehydrogenase family protein [Bacillota bacterium]